MKLYEQSVLSEFERLFVHWLLLKDELDEVLSGTVPEVDIRQHLAELQRKMLSLLSPSSIELSDFGRDDRSNLRDMRYALAAYWDDFLLQRYDWGNTNEDQKQLFRKQWLCHLIEWEAFGTRLAGKIVPDAIRCLLNSPHHTQADVSMIEVYARILWLGIGAQNDSVRGRNKALLAEINAKLAANFPHRTKAGNSLQMGWMPSAGMIGKRLAPISRWKKIIALTFTGTMLTIIITWSTLVLWLISALPAVD